jgi:hypothetical protein
MEERFRRIMGYQHLWMLDAKLKELAAQQPELHDTGGLCGPVSASRLRQARHASARWSTGLWNPLIDLGPKKGGRSQVL